MSVGALCNPGSEASLNDLLVAFLINLSVEDFPDFFALLGEERTDKASSPVPFDPEMI